MIIDIKGTKTDQVKPDPALAYALDEPARQSATPHLLAMVFIGLGLYLKSVFPGFASSRPDPGPVAQPHDPSPAPDAVHLDSGDYDPIDQPPLEWPASEDWRSIIAPSLTGAVPEIGRMPVIRLTDISLKPVLIGLESGQFSVVQGLQDLAAAKAAANGAPSGAQGAGSALLPDQARVTGTEGSVAPDPATSDDRTKGSSNRPPRNEGPVYLHDVTGGAVLLIALSDLLGQSSDPDGDSLAVGNLTASSGSLLLVENGWAFQASGDFTQEITLTYSVSDGTSDVEQIARFMAIRPSVQGGAGDDLLIGTIWSDDISGGQGDDNIDGRVGDDVISGGDGDDHILGGDGDDSLFGGAGNDILIGGAGKDHLFGGDGDDRLFGGAGDDVLHGGAGDDYLSGGDGDDLLFGGDGNDVLLGGAGRDIVHGGDGDDHVIAAADGADDHFEGGDGFDTIDYAQTTLGVRIDLDQGLVTGVESGNDRIVGFEQVIGGSGDDHFVVGHHAAVLMGGDGMNTFEFLPTMLAESPNLVVHQILDFKHGDNVKISGFKMFERLYDRLEDEFEAMYGRDLDHDDIPIRVRHDRIDEIQQTIIEADFNADDTFETTILISGHHALVITEMMA